MSCNVQYLEKVVHLPEKKRILFICTHNSARSQMAEGMVNAWYGDKFEARSAGTLPSLVSPFAIKAMAELGVDISYHRSKSIKEFRNEHFDLVVTVCSDASETCPFFPGDKILHMGFPDPSSFEGEEEQVLEGFRFIRDMIKDWLKKVIPQW